jgi:hypothetical protein
VHARNIYTTRREAYGTWKIPSSNITLQSAEFLSQTAQMRAWPQQKIRQNNMMVTDTDLLQEYDYLRYLRIQNVDTTPALVAMAIASLIAGTNRYKPSEDFSYMVRTRHFSRASLRSSGHFQDYGKYSAVKPWTAISHYSKTGSEIRIVRQRVSLQRSPPLLVIVIVQPVLVALAVALKMWLRSSPVDENAGLVSLLAAVEPETLNVLNGAALSGKLSRRVSVRFVVEQNRIIVHLDEKGAHRIQSREMYY